MRAAPEMRRKLIAGNWKMYKTTAEAVGPRRGDQEGRRGRPERRARGPALHVARRGRGRGQGQPGRGRLPEHALREGGCLHGRGLRGDAEGHRRRRTRSSATPSGGSTSPRPTRASRRRRRSRSTTASRPISCVGETARRARGRQDDGGRGPAGGRDPERRLRRRGEEGRDRVRAGLGDRHRQGRDAGAGAGGPRLHPLADRREARPGRGRRAARPLRRQREARQREGPDGAARTWTAPSSAAPRSRPTRSSSSSSTTSSSHDASAVPTAPARSGERPGPWWPTSSSPRPRGRLETAVDRMPCRGSNGPWLSGAVRTWPGAELAQTPGVAGGLSACRSCRRLSPRPGAGRGDQLPGLPAAEASRLASLPARRAPPGGAAAGLAFSLRPPARAAASGRGAGAAGVPALRAARARLRSPVVLRVPAQRARRLLLPRQVVLPLVREEATDPLGRVAVRGGARQDRPPPRRADHPAAAPPAAAPAARAAHRARGAPPPRP